MYNYDDKTIIACSSGNSRCAISIIRISGKDFLDEINSFFSIELSSLTPNLAKFCKIHVDDKVLDEAVLTYFKSPHSYNGEDILEISVHGNPINVRRIIKTFTNNSSLREAYPGEFSLRAMNNKKLTLAQVEGLDLLLNANSVFSLDQGLSILGGDLKEKFIELHSAFLNHKSSLELGFDFLEDVGEEQFNKNFNESVTKLGNIIGSLYEQRNRSPYNLVKPKICLVGLPNAGKSSLFNNLLDSDRSIVSDIAGTTRDFVSEDIYIGESLYTLIDTAGIRATEDIIEKEGVKRSLSILENSFFKILLVNPSTFDKDFYEDLANVSFDLIIFSHSDDEGFKKSLSKNGLSILQNIGPIEPSDFGPIEPSDFGSIEPTNFGPIEPADLGPIEPKIEISYSANLKSSQKQLNNLIFNMISSKYLKLIDFDPVLIERHSESIKLIYEKFEEYKNTIKNIDDISIISSELNILGHCISELIGIISPDNVLHNIFDNFCIGK